MMGKYDDLLYMPHPVSKKHPQMPILDRAAQFAPFAALTGHSAAIKETARLTDSKIELDEDTRMQLDMKQQILLEMTAKQPEIIVTYFKKDARKSGGSYLTVTGNLKKIDSYTHEFVMNNNRRIPIDDIIAIESECFMGLFL
ncbi:MAG: hypothetical protein U0L12_05765 [Ruminococcus sp.]|nr:hypothetical protein [Ruminococcus sp.]